MEITTQKLLLFSSFIHHKHRMCVLEKAQKHNFVGLLLLSICMLWAEWQAIYELFISLAGLIIKWNAKLWLRLN